LERKSFWIVTGAAFSQWRTLAPDRENTWINPGIEFLYSKLHAAGHAHSVEVWDAEKLVGGLYGVSIGGAFFGESMFSRATNASLKHHRPLQAPIHLNPQKQRLLLMPELLTEQDKNLKTLIF